MRPKMMEMGRAGRARLSMPRRMVVIHKPMRMETKQEDMMTQSPLLSKAALPTSKL
jgi:hypothetical protein